jgi:hypothetical protein
VANAPGKGSVRDGEGSGYRERVQEDGCWAAGAAVEPCLHFEAGSCAKAVQEGLEGARRCMAGVLVLCRWENVADDGGAESARLLWP